MSLETDSIRPKLVVFLLCLAINVVVLIAVGARNPNYLQDYRAAGTKDGKGYVRLGENLILRGEYSRHTEPPYVSTMHRPPLYPLVAGSLHVVFGPGGIYAAQAVFHAIACVLLLEIGTLCFSRRTGFWAAILFALNFIYVNANLKPLSEVTFTLLVLAGLWLILKAISTSSDRGSGTLHVVLGGLCFGLSIVTRPVGLYLPVLGVVALIVGCLASRRPMQALIWSVLFVVFSYLPATAWIARNHQVFGLARLTSTDASMQVYYLGTAAYQIQHGISREEAHAMIREEYGLPSFHELHNSDFVGGDIREMYYPVKRAAKPILLEYPPATLRAGATGIARSLRAHTGSSLANAMAMEWNRPKLDRLMKGDKEAVNVFFSNAPFLWGVVAWELLLSAASLLLAAVATVLMLVRPTRQKLGAWLVMLVAAYFCAMPALSAFVASYRAGIPVWPFIMLLAAYAIDHLRKAKANPED